MHDGDDVLPHAPSTVDLRAIAVAASLIGGGIVIAIAVPWLIIARSPSPAGAPNNARRPAIAGPVLQTAAPVDLEAFRREKRDRAGSAGR